MEAPQLNKSVLPTLDSFTLDADDTSLALPPKDNTKAHSSDRSFRVQQQVQLTLARKGKKTTFNGSHHLSRKPSVITGSRDGTLSDMKRHSPLGQIGGRDFSSLSSLKENIRSPSKRVDLTPVTSPELPRSHLAYGTLRFGTYTLPGPSQPPMMATSVERSYGTDLRRRYAHSEVARSTRTQAMANGGNYHWGQSLRQTRGPQPLSADHSFLCSSPAIRTDNSPYLMEVQRGARRQTGYGSFNATQRAEGLAWLGQVGRESQEHVGAKWPRSYPASLVSMEVDMAQKREAVEPEIQQKYMNEVTALKPENKVPELTLERAVNLLGQDNEEIQITAASFIQNQCFNSADAKKMVFYLHGIPKLIKLLQSDSEELERIATGALRNIVFESSENKMEVKDNEGVAPVLRLLRRSRNIATRRQITGLLWNLSSHDLLKEHLSKEALEILTTSVLVPCSGLSEGENPKDSMLADPDTFYNATGCLRNISSAGPEGRKAMRQCENLIDSLVYYIRGTIADYKPDDKSTENCVCILHNLSYQVELPQKYASELHESRLNLAPKTKTPGCFGTRSAKIIQRLEPKRPLLEEKGSPCGIEWLWSAITVRMYLSIMARSICPYTQEAAIGALQNITAGNGLVSQAIAHTIVQRENGLLQAMKMLQEGGMDVKKTAVSLLCNISRYRELHAHIVKQLLPQLVVMLPNSDTSTDLPTEVTVSLCHILINLSQDETQHVRAIVNHGALPKIINISANDNGFGPTRAGQAACILLHSMWSHSELHRAYRKAGYRKADFVNSRTSKAVH
ncbi:plakophilin-2 [Salmo salar]|uniref:Plakophilin-2 n=1 Tax=Salmo salar TaxID=8030 RepID=A0A1S3N1X3_SALSA|nr:plakophilin-2-like [Salmo salar]